MKIYLSSDNDGHELKEYLITAIKQAGYDVVNLTEKPAEDFVDSTALACKALQEDKNSNAIVVDAYGAGSYMVANKYEGIIPAELSDERTAYMTKEHNNARMITLGSEIVGKDLAENISLEFLRAEYDGGRHQVRVDMLNAMC